MLVEYLSAFLLLKHLMICDQFWPQLMLSSCFLIFEKAVVVLINAASHNEKYWSTFLAV